MSPLGATSLDADLSISMDAPSINLNSGSFGVSRLNDLTLADATTDPAFYLFWQNQAIAATALPVATDPGSTTALANAIKAFLIAFTSTYPTSLTGKINSASTTVKAGG